MILLLDLYHDLNQLTLVFIVLILIINNNSDVNTTVKLF